MTRAEAEELCQLLNADSPRNIRLYVCEDSAQLPCGKTAARDVCFEIGQHGIGPHLRRARTESRSPTQERNSMRDVRLCRLAITVTSAARSFDEPHSDYRQFMRCRFLRRCFR